MSLFFTLPTTKHRYSFVLLASMAVALFWASLSQSLALPPVIKLKKDTAGNYQELHFQTEKGVLYTLQKSSDIVNWVDDLSFIGGGQLAELRLFALHQDVAPENGNDAPYETVSTELRTVTASAGGGTFVSWVSLEDGSVKRAHLAAVELDPNLPNVYIGLKNGYYLFLSHNTALDVLDPDSIVSGKDLSFKNALPAILAGITTDSNNETTALKPHRPYPAASKQFWRIQSDPEADSDGDGISNKQEVTDHTDMFDPDTDNDGASDGQLLDTDGDSVPDIYDADPKDKAITWKRIQETPYAVLDLSLPAGVDLSEGWGHYLGEGGHVLLSKDKSDEWTLGNGAPEKSYFHTYVWNPRASAWSGALELPDNLRGIGVRVDAEGNVYGRGCCSVSDDTGGPGAKRTSLRWAKDATSGWDTAVAEREIELAASFSNQPDTWTKLSSLYLVSDSGYETFGLFGKTGRLVISEEMLGTDERKGRIQRIYSTDTSIGEALAKADMNHQISELKIAGEPNGWNVATWTQSANTGQTQHYKFSKFTEPNMLTEANPPAGQARWTLRGLSSIDPSLHPTHPEGTQANDIIIWQNTHDEIQIGQRADEASDFTWQTSTKTDTSERIGGKINSRGEGLLPDKLWRNGKWTPLDDLVDSTQWPNIQGLDINSEGTILARSGAKLVLLVPLQIKIPILASDYTDTGELKTAQQIRIAKMNEGFIDDRSRTAHSNFTERVLDRFYIRMPKVQGIYQILQNLFEGSFT